MKARRDVSREQKVQKEFKIFAAIQRITAVITHIFVAIELH